MSFIAGRYNVTLGGSTVGQLADGIRLEHTVYKEDIRGDNFMQQIQDALFHGQDMSAAYELIEYNATSARAAFWPYGSGYLNQSVVIATLDTANAGQLILTALAGTPAAATPASMTFPLAILQKNFPLGILFSPRLRRVPIRQQLYSNSSGVFGTST